MTGKYKAYPEYKGSGVEWLGKLPSHWEAKRLGQFFVERREKVSDKDYPALSVTMKGIVPQLENAAKSDAGDNRKLVRKYDFVINSRSDRKGSSGISPLEGSVSLISIVMEPTGIVPSYAHHLLRSQPFQEEFYRFGKGIVADLWSTNSSEMKNILIPEVPVDEAEKIASFLDHETAKIDTLIDKQQQLIQLLKEKRQAVISHAVTKGLDPNAPMRDSGVEWLGEVPEHWERKSLNYLIAHTVDNRGRTPPIVEEGIPMVEVSQVAGNGLFTSNNYSKFITPESYQQFVRSDVQENDILFVTVGATFGKTCLVPPMPDFFIAQNVVGFRCVKDVDPKFFMFLFSSSIFKEAVSATNKSSTIDNVKVSDLVKTRVVIPPHKEQKEIASHIFKVVEKYEALVAKADSVISLLQERRAALISAAVTGKIDVRHWQAPAPAQSKEAV